MKTFTTTVLAILLFVLSGCKATQHTGRVCGKRYVAAHSYQTGQYIGRVYVPRTVFVPNTYYLSVSDGDACGTDQTEIETTEGEYNAVLIDSTKVTYFR